MPNSGVEISSLVELFRISISCNLSQDVDRKLARYVVDAPETRLFQRCIPSLFPGIAGSRKPHTRNHSGPKRACIQRNCRAQLPLRPVVHGEVPGNRVLGAWPEVAAAAQIVARFVSHHSISESMKGAGDHERSITRSQSLSVSFHPASPLRRTAPSLIDSGPGYTEHVRSCRQKSLMVVNIESLQIGQRMQQASRWNVRPDDPLRGKIADVL